MGRMARSALARLSPFFWLAAVVLAVLLASDPHWSAGAARQLVGLVILTTGAAIGGTACGAIEATHDASIEMLLGALLADRPTPGPRSRRHRAAA